VMLLAGEGLDSSGFFDWFGFFATETQSFESFSQHAIAESKGCVEQVSTLLMPPPDMVFVAVDTSQMLQCMLKAYERSRREGQPPVPMVLVDTGLSIRHLPREGPRAYGLQGFTATPAPDNGFEEAFIARSGLPSLPSDAANAYDAVLLLGYALHVSGGQGGRSLFEALEAVASYDGTPVGWDSEGVQAGVHAIDRGESPNISGATGQMAFDPQLGMDLDAAWYAHWRLTPRGFETIQHYHSGAVDSYSLRPNEGPTLDEPSVQDIPTPGPAGERWAVIASLSEGWGNYRHLADALAHYKYLRAQGFSDERIILIGHADLMNDPENTEPGVIRNVAEGEDLARDLTWDYPSALSSQGVLNIIQGVVTDETPIVVPPDAGNSIFVYLAGHGSPKGITIGAQTAGEAAQLSGETSGQFLTPTALRQALCTLQDANKYRHVFLSLESCASGAMGDAAFDGVEAGCDEGPLYRVLIFTSARPAENSLSTNYDADSATWRSNEYSWRFLNEFTTSSDQTFYDLYEDVYLGVSGSHVSVYNHHHFGPIREMGVESFLR
jgi:glycosylphosphatidylinositol transamidase (GPIT) subunit GPI8